MGWLEVLHINGIAFVRLREAEGFESEKGERCGEKDLTPIILVHASQVEEEV